METMRAIVRDRYGTVDALEVREVPRPEVADDGVLVRVHASSVNRRDWYSVRGRPFVARASMGLLRPRSPLIGGDFAGTVEAVGKDVTDLKPGDEVFGARDGAFAEYVCVRNGVAPKPANLSFEEAASIPTGATTALQALRDRAHVQPGQHVLVNGASGSVGIFAVQIAKALGAEVTAVCSTRNVELVRSLGADHVVDYTRDDFTRNGRRYDALIDVAGSRSWSECRRVLAPEATLVIVGAPATGPLGPVGHLIGVRVASLRGSQKARFFVANLNRSDLRVLRELVDSGKVRAVVERRYELSQVPEALRYMAGGHVQSKLAVTIRGRV